MPDLASKSSCTGCSACMSICPKQCISMQQDDNGFCYPIINLLECVACGYCERVCPVINKQNYEKTLPAAFAAYSMNEAMRLESSSGGVFSEVAQKVLEKNGAVYGAAYNEHFEVHHVCVEKGEDLSKLRGAKYAQSILDDTYKEIWTRLQTGQPVLFSGTPCQIAGLKAFLRKDYENLICVDFICHGVPSPMAWKKYIKYRMEEDKEKTLPIVINLRDKNTGWSKYTYSNVFRYADGKAHSSKSSDSLFMNLFVGDYINRESCTECHFKGYSRISDITLGDFWGIWDIAPKMDDDKGTSAVLLQSEKGKQIWKQIQENILYQEVSLEQVSQQNLSIIKSSRAKKEREEILTLIRMGKINECKKLFVGSQKSVFIRLKNKFRCLMQNGRKINGKA